MQPQRKSEFRKKLLPFAVLSRSLYARDRESCQTSLSFHSFRKPGIGVWAERHAEARSCRIHVPEMASINYGYFSRRVRQAYELTKRIFIRLPGNSFRRIFLLTGTLKSEKTRPALEKKRHCEKRPALPLAAALGIGTKADRRNLKNPQPPASKPPPPEINHPFNPTTPHHEDHQSHHRLPPHESQESHCPQVRPAQCPRSLHRRAPRRDRRQQCRDFYLQ